MRGRDDVSAGARKEGSRVSDGAEISNTGTVGNVGNVGNVSAAVMPGGPVVVPGNAVPAIPDKDRRTNAATAASAASVRALSAQALQFYFRAPVKAFFRTRVDYLAYARGPDGHVWVEPVGIGGGGGNGPLPLALSSSSPATAAYRSRLRTWLRGTTPGVLTLAIKRYGWSVVPDQVMPPLIANVGVAAVLYTSYLQILSRLHPESGQARRRVYPPPAPMETFTAGFLAGSIQSLAAAPLDAIQARYDHKSTTAVAPAHSAAAASPPPKSMWAFSRAKLREIGLRGIFAGWGLSFLKDSCGNAVFFSVFEYVKAQSYYRFVAYYYGAPDTSLVRAWQRHSHPDAAAQRRQQEGEETPNQHHHHLHHHHDGHDSFASPPPPPLAHTDSSPRSAPPPIVIRPHYALEPLFLLLAGISASLAQHVLLHPLTHMQVIHWDLLEDLDAAAKAETLASTRSSAAAAPARARFHVVRTYYHAYQETWRRCAVQAAAEGRSRAAWLYRDFWWNAIRQVPSTSAGLIIFELVRRKYGMAGEEVRIRQDGYDILLA